MKTAVVTGASGLIGTELCRRYIQSGYAVFGLDIQPGKFKDPSYRFIKCDLSKESSIRSAFRKIKSLDVVINNAAATDLTFKPFEKVTLKDWERGLSINLTSYFLVAQLSYKMLKASSGSMVNISSTRHMMSEPNTLIYSASKGGVSALTHSLAISWGPHVRVNSVSPGWIAASGDKLKPKDHKQHPAGRVGRPQDIAEMCHYLTSDEAGFITGQDFIVDGGMTRKMIYE